MHNKTYIRNSIKQIKFTNFFIKYKLFFAKMGILDFKNYEKTLKENENLFISEFQNSEEYFETNICLQPKLYKSGFHQPELIWLKYNRFSDRIYISIFNEYREVIIRRGEL